VYKVVFSTVARKDYDYWRRSGNVGVVKRIHAPLEDIALHPFTGIGKPEALKYDLAGKWSRRANGEHRIVYAVRDDLVKVHVLSMRYHYDS
jgi:toxin YoeB